MPTPADIFIKDLEAIEALLYKEVQVLYAKLANMTQTDAVEIIRNINFSKELDRLGLSIAVNKYAKTLDKKIVTLGRQAVKSGLNISKIDLTGLEVLRDLDIETIVAKHLEFVTDLQRTIIRSLTVKTPKAKLIKQFQEMTSGGLTSKQASLAVHESLARFDRTVTMKVTEKIPDVRYVYLGPIDSKNDPATCAIVLADPRNMSGIGFTREEIMTLPVDMAIGGHFNCRHFFGVATVQPEGAV